MITDSVSLLIIGLCRFLFLLNSVRQFVCFYFFHFSSGPGYDSAFWDGGRPGSRAAKSLCLRTQIRQTCTPLSSLVRLCHQLDSAGEPSCWLGLHLNAAGWNSVCHILSVSYCKPFPSSLSQIPGGQAPQTSLQFPWGETGVGAPKK